MEQRSNSLGLVFYILSCLLLLLLSFAGSVEAYKNYTVGDSLGWYDNLLKPNVNYQKWVAGKNFSLGDFLIFNTDNNHSVVQTYNVNTYKRCDYYNAEEKETTEWSAADPSSTSPHPVSVAVPLLKLGITYFFSGDYDGEQCQHGQHFKINVTYGQGLPIQDDPSPPPTTTTTPDDDQPTPDTVIPSNFNHPQDQSSTTDVTKESASIPLSLFTTTHFNAFFIFLAFISSF
ncbi:hypothetical protein F0562_022643 [Nyssa sinensis]|uniref:Phytocyanin domain-containing protein n=1 Tax=Nyssa sinensis TaxID=561372 RepID=A0A5J5BTP5_9ASTE|nr:hypothetical protein F0562_022643 [Nyssa sinensis]